MDSSALLAQFRSDVNDIAAPYLWSDEEFFLWLDEAQKQFCREGNGISDATSPLTVAAAPANAEWVDISDRITRVRGAFRKPDGKPIKIISYEDMDALNLRFDGLITSPDYLITGLEDNKLRLYPGSKDGVELHFLIDRMPASDITGDGQALEIAPQHHLALLYWVKYRAYGKQDAEARDDKKAQENYAFFMQYAQRSSIERDRLRHKPRAVRYGGI